MSKEDKNNSIYQIYEPNVDKQGVKNYAIKTHVVDYFKSSYSNLKQHIIKRSTNNLIDKNGENCSMKLKEVFRLLSARGEHSE